MRLNQMMAGARLNALVDHRIFCQDATTNDYSRNLEDAWKITKRFANVPFSLFRGRSGWFANFEMNWDPTLQAETPCAAICYAGLKREYMEEHITDPDIHEKARMYMEGLFGYRLEGGGW